MSNLIDQGDCESVTWLSCLRLLALFVLVLLPFALPMIVIQLCATYSR